MGRLIRWGLAAVAGAGIGLVAAGPTMAFDGFGEASADSTYDEEMRFEVDLRGDAPDTLELLLRTPGAGGSFVAPVEPAGGSATYVWDTAIEYVTPNTPVTYQWRAIDEGEVVLGPEATIRYEDDRPGLDWQRAQLGEATVHWYGDAEAQARRFGELTAEGVARAEQLLGTQLAGPVDVFVYATADDFFGATGPGVREWTGAVAYSELRTIFMLLEGQSASYLEVAMVHEVTHIVFHDATDNPYHEPPRWLNEGIAVWSEAADGGQQPAIVASAAATGGLFSFEAITAQFPIGAGAAELAYAQGTTMIDMIVDQYGPAAIAGIAAAYREGASDAEALEAGTGVPADQLYADFFARFGVSEPQPVAPEPIAASNVDRPVAGAVDPGGVDGGPGEEPAEPPEAAPGNGRRGSAVDAAVVVALLAVAAIASLGGAAWMSRRADRRAR
jgi:Peptidase MA superfamily